MEGIIEKGIGRKREGMRWWEKAEKNIGIVGWETTLVGGC